jgi:recombinational DNA repair protein (RecF pathway)
MHADAIVLKTWPYSESSLIVWLLLREQGAVRALAKGARRLKGRTASALDGFSMIRASIRLPQRDGLAMLGAVELRRSWGYLHHDLRRLALASTAMEILGAVAADSPHEVYFFDEAATFLDGLETTVSPGSLTAALLLRLLHHAGYAPRLGPGLDFALLPEVMGYDFTEGSFVDAAAMPHRAQVMRLPSELAPIVASAAPPPLTPDFILPARLGPITLRWLVRAWADHLHQNFRSMEFLEQTVLATAPGPPAEAGG